MVANGNEPLQDACMNEKTKAFFFGPPFSVSKMGDERVCDLNVTSDAGPPSRCFILRGKHGGSCLPFELLQPHLV